MTLDKDLELKITLERLVEVVSESYVQGYKYCLEVTKQVVSIADLNPVIDKESIKLELLSKLKERRIKVNE